MNLPCEECITLSICKNSYVIMGHLCDKCSIIAEFTGWNTEPFSVYEWLIKADHIRKFLTTPMDILK